MKKFYDIEIDSQVELENGKTLGKLDESKISVNDGNCSSGGGDFILDNAIFIKENDDESTMDEYPYVSFAGEENPGLFLIICAQFEAEDTGELVTKYDCVIPQDVTGTYSSPGPLRTSIEGKEYIGITRLIDNDETEDGHLLFTRSTFWCEYRDF